MYVGIFDVTPSGGICGKGDGAAVDGNAVMDVDEMGRVEVADAEGAKVAAEQG